MQYSFKITSNYVKKLFELMTVNTITLRNMKLKMYIKNASIKQLRTLNIISIKSCKKI